MAQIKLIIKLDVPALHKELQDAVDKIKAKLSEVGTVDVDFNLDELQRDLNKVKAKFEDIEKPTENIKGNVREAGLELLKWIGIAQLVRSAFNFLIDSKNIARDAAEIQSKFDAVFQNLKAEANAWSENFAKNVGRAKSDVKKWMSELQDTFVPLGYTRTKAMELSQSLTQLAVDVASFNNAADADVIKDFTSALVGNHQTVRKYGILINENTLKQQAEIDGIKKKYESLTELEKVQLRYNIILRGTADAQGDAIRTADSLANQEKRQEAELRNLQEQLGNKVVPAFLLVTKATMGWIQVINELLGVVGSLINKSQVMATQIEELNNVQKVAGKGFEEYRKNLQLDLEKKVENAKATVKLAEAELKYAAIKRDMWGVFGKIVLPTTDEERALKNAHIQLETFSAQLEAVKNFGKEVVEETSNVTTKTVEKTNDKIKQMRKDLEDNERRMMDKLLDDEEIWIEQLADARIGGYANMHGRIRAMEDETAQHAVRVYNRLTETQKQQMQVLQQEYQQHFNFLFNAMQTSTSKEMSVANQLQRYLLNLLKQYLAQYIATKIAESTIHASTEAEKTATTEQGTLARLGLMALEIAKQLAVAAASILTAIAEGIASLFSTFGPFAIPLIAGMSAAVIGIFNGIKKSLGFKRGGYTGSGERDEEAGIVHKGEYVFEKSLVDKEPAQYALLHKLLRAGYSLTDIMLGIKRATSPILDAPLALAGINFGSATPSGQAAESTGILRDVKSLLQSMDDRLKKIEDKEFKLKGDMIAETKLKNREIAIAVKLGNKEIERGKS